MKGWVVAGALLSLVVIGYESSGQAQVSGVLTTPDGAQVSGCSIDRDLRLGVGFGGFDGKGLSTGDEGQFGLPVNRGLNRLTFACPGGGEAAAIFVVARHFTYELRPARA